MGDVITLGHAEDIESRKNPAVRQALPLMKEALALLDAGGAGWTTGARNLSLAIDRAEERPVHQTEEEFLAMLDETLVSAFDAKAVA